MQKLEIEFSEFVLLFERPKKGSDEDEDTCICKSVAHFELAFISARFCLLGDNSAPYF